MDGFSEFSFSKTNLDAMAECLPRQRSNTNTDELYVIRNGASVLHRTSSDDFMDRAESMERRERPQKPPPLAPKPQLSRPGSTSSLSSVGKAKSRAQAKKAKDEEIEESLRRMRSQGKYVKLNVGGSLHYTTLATLTKHDCMLRAMFSERIPLETDDEGWVLLDRSGKHFGFILNFLRDGSVSLPETKNECTELLAEAKYYCIDELIEVVETQLGKLKDEHQPICRVPVITSLDEEHLIVSTSMKPVIKLLYNRGNNKYSYTPNSDDNLLKNIELFDKLAVRFGSRVKFMKDIVGRGEICCWAFYGRGKKIAEVCCESIVYATDRKHTKIEFPEAKILDETLNIMLYENRNDDSVPVTMRAPERSPGTPDGMLSEEEF